MLLITLVLLAEFYLLYMTIKYKNACDDCGSDCVDHFQYWLKSRNSGCTSKQLLHDIDEVFSQVPYVDNGDLPYCRRVIGLVILKLRRDAEKKNIDFQEYLDYLKRFHIYGIYSQFIAKCNAKSIVNHVKRFYNCDYYDLERYEDNGSLLPWHDKYNKYLIDGHTTNRRMAHVALQGYYIVVLWSFNDVQTTRHGEALIKALLNIKRLRAKSARSVIPTAH